MNRAEYLKSVHAEIVKMTDEQLEKELSFAEKALDTDFSETVWWYSALVTEFNERAEANG